MKNKLAVKIISAFMAVTILAQTVPLNVFAKDDVIAAYHAIKANYTDSI